MTQVDIVINGHSIESRINAEKPVTFRPSPGKILQYRRRRPRRADRFRRLSGLRRTALLDSLVGKLIVHGKTRAECLMRLRRALDEIVVEGIEAALPLFRALVLKPTLSTATSYPLARTDLSGQPRLSG